MKTLQNFSPRNEAEATQELRRRFPTMRRERSTAIVHSGGERTIFGCVCGAEHTCATSYRQAKHVRQWREDHAGCSAKLLKTNEAPSFRTQ